MSGVSLTLSLEEYLTLKLVHTQSPEIHQNYHVSVPTRLWLQCLLPQINWFQLWFSVLSSVSRFGCGSLLCNFSSLMDLRKVIAFQLVQCFSCCELWNDNFQAFLHVRAQKTYFNTFIELCFTYYKIHLFQVYNWMIFSNFTEWCNHHHKSVLEYIHLPVGEYTFDNSNPFIEILPHIQT